MKTPPTVVALTGVAAAREYASFFHDPVGCMRRLSREHGRLIALSRVPTPSKHDKMHVIAVGPEYNRLVLGDAEVFRTTGQMIRGPDA